MSDPASTLRRPRSLALEVVEQLTQDIRQQRLATGQKLPTEAEVMERFGVSRTVVREAISRLQAAGLVETRHGVGTFVLAPSDTPAFRVSAQQLGTLREVIALLELRIAIETEAAALAAARRDERQLDAMRDAMTTFSEAIEAGHDAVHADLRFHQALAQATGNDHFADVLESLGRGAIPRARVQVTPEVPAERQAYLRRVNQEHESIFNAIAAQDAEAARAAMRTHLSNSRDRLRQRESPGA